MGCMAIRKSQGFTELWCDDPSDVLGEWIEDKFGYTAKDLDNPVKSKKIFYKILNNKSVFMQGYNKVKKNFYAEGEPKRDMTLFEYIFHLHFVLGLGVHVNLDTTPLPAYLHRTLGKSGKCLMYGGMGRPADRSVFTIGKPGKVVEKPADTKKQKPGYNPFAMF